MNLTSGRSKLPVEPLSHASRTDGSGRCSLLLEAKRRTIRGFGSRSGKRVKRGSCLRRWTQPGNPPAAWFIISRMAIFPVTYDGLDATSWIVASTSRKSGAATFASSNVWLHHATQSILTATLLGRPGSPSTDLDHATEPFVRVLSSESSSILVRRSNRSVSPVSRSFSGLRERPPSRPGPAAWAGTAIGRGLARTLIISSAPTRIRCPSRGTRRGARCVLVIEPRLFAHPLAMLKRTSSFKEWCDHTASNAT